MNEQRAAASEVRDNFADYLEGVDKGRVLVTKHGQERAYLIGVRELRALEETIGVLENEELMKSLARGLDDLRAGQVQDAADAFAELDAEVMNEE
ncbi:MAG: type II toxin-antitoxin system Phd/YefM family antitoxin [Planctomycetota bacterium]|jgi:prevent-host-death family protein